ncbi:uncharacterized protein LOC121390581 [Gigantopelta aegis]|uniref:uncharacterized protein LOC121390581 n=1 Tax=Gigantopelta aegis TaxID=1735272 RepID=UPI001B88C044|nr:uncharacterized protein LOC121390581 [Gigantopelta aegis]
MEDHEHVQKMQQLLLKICTSDKSALIGPERYCKIVDILQGVRAPDNSFKFWMKKKDFQLIDIPSSNETDVLVAPGKLGLVGPDVGYVRVLKFDDVYPAVWDIHVNEQHHAGYKKCIDAVNKLYYRIPRSYIQQFIRACPTCWQNKRKADTGPLFEIPEKRLQKSILEKIKVNTIDVHHVSTAGYTHVGIVEDQYSKFVVIFPLKSNTPADLAEYINHYYLGVFGPPNAFVSDNGQQFMDQVLHELMHTWTGIPLTLVNDTPPFVSPQDVSDRCNIILDTITTLISDRGGDSCSWHNWLPDIALRLNTTRNEFKRSPYNLVFGHDAYGGEYNGNVIIKSVDENCNGGGSVKNEIKHDPNSSNDDIIDAACSTAFVFQKAEQEALVPSGTLLASIGLERRILKREHEAGVTPEPSDKNPPTKLAKHLLPEVGRLMKRNKKIRKPKLFSLAGCGDKVVVKATTGDVMKTLERSKLGVIESASPDVRRARSRVRRASLEESNESLASDAESSSGDEHQDVLNLLTKSVGDEKTKIEILKTIVTSLVLTQKNNKLKRRKGKTKP